MAARDGRIRSRDLGTDQANRRVIADEAIWPEHLSPAVIRFLREGLLPDAPKVIHRHHQDPAEIPDINVCETGEEFTDLDEGVAEGWGYGTDYVVPVSGGNRSDSAVELDDGRVLYAWVENENSIRVGRADSLDDFLTDPGSVTEVTVVEDNLDGSGRQAPGCAVFRLPDGRLMLHTAWRGQDGDGESQVRLYESTDDGDTWSVHATLDSASPGGGAGHYGVGVPLELDSGRLVLPSTALDAWGDDGRFGIYTSDDGGDSWTRRFSHGGGALGGAYNRFHGRSVVEVGGWLFATYAEEYNEPIWWLAWSYDDGETWSHTSREADGSSDPRFVVALFADPAHPDELRGIGYNYTSGGNARLLRSATPTDQDSWTVVGDVEWSRSGDRGAGRQRPIVQRIAGEDTDTLMWNGRVARIASPGVEPLWRGLLFRAPGGLPAWCLRVDGAGRLSTLLKQGEADPDERSFAFLSDIPDGLGDASLDDLADVDAPDPSDGDALVWNDSEEAWVPGEAGGAVAVDDDGAEVTAEASRLNFGDGLSVTDDGDGAVTIDADATNGSGEGAYAETVGDGTETTFVVTHDLGTTDVVVQLWNQAPADPELATGDADSVEVVDADTVRVTFPTAPSTDQYRVVVLAGGGSTGGAAGVWEHVATAETTSPAAKIEFTNIDSAYSAFRITVDYLGVSGEVLFPQLRLNDDSASNYRIHRLSDVGGWQKQTRDEIPLHAVSSDTAGQRGHSTITITQRASAHMPRVLIMSNNRDEASLELTLIAGLWTNPSEQKIATIGFEARAGEEFDTGSVIVLEGMRE